MGSFLPENDGNRLSEELFVYDTVIRVLPFTGLHPLVHSTAAQMMSQHASMASCSAKSDKPCRLLAVQGIVYF